MSGPHSGHGRRLHRESVPIRRDRFLSAITTSSGGGATSTRTRATPCSSKPRSWAARRERSMIRPCTNGPRSLMRTVITPRVLKVRHARVGRHRQRLVGGGEAIHVVNLAVRRRLTVKRLTVPGRDSGLEVVWILLRVVPDAVDLVRIAHLVRPLGRRNHGRALRPRGGFRFRLVPFRDSDGFLGRVNDETRRSACRRRHQERGGRCRHRTWIWKDRRPGAWLLQVCVTRLTPTSCNFIGCRCDPQDTLPRWRRNPICSI